MRVEVTQEDIEQGMRGSLGACPIALAVRRALKVDSRPGPKIRVNSSRIAIGDGRAILPDEAAEFVDRFDRGDPVEPFAFDLPEP